MLIIYIENFKGGYMPKEVLASITKKLRSGNADDTAEITIPKGWLQIIDANVGDSMRMELQKGSKGYFVAIWVDKDE